MLRDERETEYPGTGADDLLFDIPRVGGEFQAQLPADAEGLLRIGHRKDPPEDWLSDYIVAPAPVKSAGYRLWTQKKGELFLSDHYPVSAEVDF